MEFVAMTADDARTVHAALVGWMSSLSNPHQRGQVWLGKTNDSGEPVTTVTSAATIVQCVQAALESEWTGTVTDAASLGQQILNFVGERLTNETLLDVLESIVPTPVIEDRELD